MVISKEWFENKRTDQNILQYILQFLCDILWYKIINTKTGCKKNMHAISKKKKFTTIFTWFEVPVVYISEFERSRENLINYTEKNIGTVISLREIEFEVQAIECHLYNGHRQIPT